jgi:hypothetical protein
MRVKQIVPGLKNSQRIRVILNGIGFVTTVQDANNMPFTSQNTAVNVALHRIVDATKTKSTGIGTRVAVYDHKMARHDFDIQIDLI